MSHDALLLATRDQLRDTPALGLDSTNCEVTHDGSPFPSAGELFVAVHPGYWRDAGSNGQSLHEEFGVNVTVTLRLPRAPLDRWGPELLAKAGKGVMAVARKVVVVIHMDPLDSYLSSVIVRANQLIGATEENGFITPLQFMDGGSPPQIKPGAWFSAKGEAHAGLAQTVSFGKALRVQKIEEQAASILGVVTASGGVANLPGNALFDSSGNVLTGSG